MLLFILSCGATFGRRPKTHHIPELLEVFDNHRHFGLGHIDQLASAHQGRTVWARPATKQHLLSSFQHEIHLGQKVAQHFKVNAPGQKPHSIQLEIIYAWVSCWRCLLTGHHCADAIWQYHWYLARGPQTTQLNLTTIRHVEDQMHWVPGLAW